MMQKIHKHQHIHNNLFQPDSAVMAEVTDEEWSKDYDLEILATRHIGNNRYIIVSIPHFVYGIQRYDIVFVDAETDIIKSIEHSGRNTSLRIAFNSGLTEDSKLLVLNQLESSGYSIDPFNSEMVSLDLDVENSREEVLKKMNELQSSGQISEWEYAVQDDQN
jgi:hypothetical protein